MRTNQILIFFAACLNLLFMGDWLFASEAFEVTEDQKDVEPSQDSVVKNLVLPLRLTAIISTTATAVVWSKYSRTHKNYMNAKDIDKISEYYDRSNKYYKLRNGLIITTGLLWGANLVTLWLKPPAGEADEFESISETGKMRNVASARWSVYHIEDGLALSWSKRF